MYIITPSFYIGVDTHKFTHTACVINTGNDKLLTFTFKNQPRYFDEVLIKIKLISKHHAIIFGLEDTQSFGFLFSNYLTQKGYEVKQVNPALANAYRISLPNFHKSDAYDAYCVAKVLKDSYKQLPTFRHEILYSNIRLLISQRTQITKQQAQNYITLHQQLSKVYPGYTEFFSTIYTRSALSFFYYFPIPKQLKGYSAESLAEEMKQYTRIFSKVKAAKILDVVRSNQTPYDDAIIKDLIIDIIQDIYDKEAKITHLESKLKTLILETGYRLETMPGVSVATAGKIISEIGDINRFKSEKQLARYAGIAPVSIGSAGKNKEEHSRGGNRTLRATFYFLAVGMISTNINQEARHPYFRDYFLKKLQEGKTKQQALICIMRQLLRIVYVMMKHKSEWKTPEYKQKYEVEEIKSR